MKVFAHEQAGVRMWLLNVIRDGREDALIELRAIRDGRVRQEWHADAAAASRRADELTATSDVYVGALARFPAQRRT